MHSLRSAGVSGAVVKGKRNIAKGTGIMSGGMVGFLRSDSWNGTCIQREGVLRGRISKVKRSVRKVGRPRKVPAKPEVKNANTNNNEKDKTTKVENSQMKLDKIGDGASKLGRQIPNSVNTREDAHTPMGGLPTGYSKGGPNCPAIAMADTKRALLENGISGSSQRFIEIQIPIREIQKIQNPDAGAMDEAAEGGSVEISFDDGAESEILGQDGMEFHNETTNTAVETWIDRLRYDVEHSQALKRAVAEAEEAVFGDMAGPSTGDAVLELNGSESGFGGEGAEQKYDILAAMRGGYCGFGGDGAGHAHEDEMSLPSIGHTPQMMTATACNRTVAGTETAAKKRLAKRILKRMEEAKIEHKAGNQKYKKAMKAGKTVLQALEILSGKIARLKKTFRFLDLPLEIRIIVYEQVLVIGNIYIKQQAAFDEQYSGSYRYQRPETQLLRVNRQIKSECDPIFYGRNNFVLPLGFEPGLYDYPPLFRANEFIRSIDVTFDMRADSGDRADLRDVVERDYDSCFYAGAFSSLDPIFQADDIHQSELDQLLQDCWPAVAQTIHQYQLDFLRIDLGNAYCPTGCHRLAEWVVADHIKCSMAKEIQFVGVRDLAEKKKILHIMRFSTDTKITFKQKHTYYGEEGRFPCVEYVSQDFDEDGSEHGISDDNVEEVESEEVEQELDDQDEEDESSLAENERASSEDPLEENMEMSERKI